MTKFKVGDKVQLTLDSFEYYDNHSDSFYSGYDWDDIYSSNLTISHIHRENEDDSSLYGIKETDVGFYEFELERYGDERLRSG